MKYLIRDRGLEWFKAETEKYLGKPFEPFRPLPEWESPLYVGWGEQVRNIKK